MKEISIQRALIIGGTSRRHGHEAPAMKEISIQRALIIGGTGTLGKALLAKLGEAFPSAQITVASRDEHKQAQLKRKYPKVKFVIGDIRDRASIGQIIRGHDVVFHVAAMKHVDIVEENPIEAIKTNIDGTINVAEMCIAYGVKYMIYSSTDKAVDPINTYGYSKAIGEKVLFDLNLKQNKTKFSVYRWGNVLGSNGSVIPFFVNTLIKERRVYITHPDMTRFWLPIEWPVTYMLRTFPDASTSRAMIPPVLKAASIMELAEAVGNIVGVKTYDVKITGVRAGEKLHEVMYSQHDLHKMESNTAERFTMAELIELIRPIVLHTPMEGAA